MAKSLNITVIAAVSAFLAACSTRPAGTPLEALSPAPASAPTPSAEAPAPIRYSSLQEEFVAAAGSERVFFALDSYTLTDDAQSTLQRQARWLAERSEIQILVAGNCDERGTREYNLALGARRAQAAREALIAGGVAPGRIRTISYGKERPIAPGAGESAWGLNRNAHTVLIDASIRN